MRAEVKHRLHVAYDDIKKINPRIVYGSISGFGQTGPYGKRAGVDQIAQGMGGLMSITGEPGRGPMRVGIPMDDLTAGNLLALGVMMALFQRETHRRRPLGADQPAGSAGVHAGFPGRALAVRRRGRGPGRQRPSDRHPDRGVSDHRRAYQHRRQFRPIVERFADVIGHPEWKTKSGWATQKGRSDNRRDINAAISAITATQPAEHWIELFESAGIPCGPINTIDRVFADPQVQHLGMARPVTHPRLGTKQVVASALTLSGLSKDIRSPTRDAGADTDAVLRKIGYDDREISDMRSKGVI